MSSPSLAPLRGFINLINSINTNNTEQRALLLDIVFGLKRLVASVDQVEQIIYLGDLFKMEAYVYHVFKGHTMLKHIKQMYVEVHKYV